LGEIRSSLRGITAGRITVGHSGEYSGRKAGGMPRAKATEKQRRREMRIRG